MTSILESIKKLLGLTSEYTVFDNDIIMYINSAFSQLNQMGVGPKEGFIIEDARAEWSDFLNDEIRIEYIKNFVFLKVKQIFDPPTSSSVLEAYNNQLAELAWRLYIFSTTDGKDKY